MNYWHFVKGLPYPLSPQTAEKIAGFVPQPVNRLQVIRYGLNHWDAVRIDSEIAQVANWAKQRGLPLVCNEFGVYRKYADPESRAAWLTDVRASLEKHGIGWTVWDYSGSFGVVTKQDGKAVPDQTAVKALGLKVLTQ